MLQDENIDILFLGYHMYKQNRIDNYNKYYSTDYLNIKIEPINMDNYIGGFFGYIITKSGVDKLIKQIDSDGIKHGIDYLVKINPDLVIKETQPFIINSNWVEDSNSDVDSDIQRNWSGFDFTNIFNNPNKNLIIGFNSNQMGERGTEIALYDYAYYNQQILKNKSIIFYPKNSPNNCDEVIKKFKKVFKCYAYNNYSDIDQIVLDENINLVYNIKYGIADSNSLNNCPCINHGVFHPEPHGYKYAVLSNETNNKFGTNCEIVPHMINMPECTENLREELGIPSDAIVIGRHGGFNSFDIPFVHEAIKNYLEKYDESNPNIYFLFLNTEKFYKHPNIIYLDKIIDIYKKAKFICTCDAMIHASNLGETFGLAIGEFSFYNKPIITSISNVVNCHLDILGDKAILYNSKEDLYTIFKNIKQIISSRDFSNSYTNYTPEKVMEKFYNVFLKEYDQNYKNMKFYKGIDYGDHDIGFIGKKNFNQMFWDSVQIQEAKCFNTIGFVKNSFNLTDATTSPYFKHDDGIWVITNRISVSESESESVSESNLIIQNNKSNKIRVKMLCNWADSKTLCDEWNWMSKGDYKWNDLEITWEDNDINYYVIINKPPSNAHYIPSKTIVYQMEPQCNNPDQYWGVKTWGEWANPDTNKFFQVRTSKTHLNNVLWQFSLTYNYFKTEPIIKFEPHCNIISSICSSKYFDPGHIKRIDFLKYIEEQTDPDVQLHIYNSDNIHEFKSYQGPLTPYVNKHLGILPYKYYFMCENNPEPNFITEKMWEPIISETLVFYWGCPNISEYINPNAFVQLDMNDFAKSFQIIKDAIKNNLWEKRLPFIKEEKRKVLDYYNFFPTLERIIKQNK
jgi:hypothetical protein